MIDAKELRIGNYIQNGQGLYAIVNKVDSGIWMHFQPIIITPYILINCGFVKKEGVMFDVYRKVTIYTDAHGLQSPQMFSINEGCTNLFINNKWISRVDTFHKLQNVFYFNTGNELEVTL